MTRTTYTINNVMPAPAGISVIVCPDGRGVRLNAATPQRDYDDVSISPVLYFALVTYTDNDSTWSCVVPMFVSEYTGQLDVAHPDDTDYPNMEVVVGYIVSDASGYLIDKRARNMYTLDTLPKPLKDRIAYSRAPLRAVTPIGGNLQ